MGTVKALVLFDDVEMLTINAAPLYTEIDETFVDEVIVFSSGLLCRAVFAALLFITAALDVADPATAVIAV